MSIIDTLITNRTQADVDALLALYAKPKAMWTADEWNEFLLGSHRGAYNASDMNRVLDALDYLADRVTEFGYRKATVKRPSILDGDDVRTYYKIGDCPTVLEFAQYLENIAQIRSVLSLPADVPAVPEDIGQRITIEEANNIELILTAVEVLLNRISLSWFYSGEVYSGEV